MRSELSTDVSSRISSPVRTSPEAKLCEADKQILEWAGRLEMESVDLREQSSKLLQELHKSGNKMSELVKQLELAHNSNSSQLLQRCMKSQSQTQSVWEQRLQEQSIQAQSNQKILQGLIFRMSRQLENQHQVMISMSKDINEMQDRQIRLESKVDTRREDFKASSLSKQLLSLGMK
ncbi:hypothetical protein ZYGM_004608 [Zygosaccharomyces mellis]|uniref:Uncharacterized protein n=1 Tax=Zygosaccharomyces mellis TaxID=42258 RepID=A0A4C2E995_9SACH|nr:hypothetical protein ZYGM_004608 [Zygosaccharomyces mellis]